MELNQGDHILFRTPDSHPPLRPLYQSALVTVTEKNDIGIISYARGGLYEDCVRFDTFVKLHRVNYSKCKYSAKMSVSRAKWRLRSGEDHYHVIYNNSHFLVTWAKTGSEYLLYDVIDGIICDKGEVMYRGTNCHGNSYTVPWDQPLCPLLRGCPFLGG